MLRNGLITLTLVTLLVWVAGCYNYTPISPTEAGYYGKVRVETVDGERGIIHNPRVEADSIKGADKQAIALSQVVTVEAVSTDVPRTTQAIVFGLGAVIGLALLFSCDGLLCVGG